MEERPGYDVVGPPLPGSGVLISVGCCEGGGIFAIRYVGGDPPTATWVLPDGAKEWERLWLN